VLTHTCMYAHVHLPGRKILPKKKKDLTNSILISTYTYSCARASTKYSCRHIFCMICIVSYNIYTYTRATGADSYMHVCALASTRAICFLKNTYIYHVHKHKLNTCIYIHIFMRTCIYNIFMRTYLYQGESFYNSRIPPIVKELTDMGLFSYVM